MIADPGGVFSADNRISDRADPLGIGKQKAPKAAPSADAAMMAQLPDLLRGYGGGGMDMGGGMMPGAQGGGQPFPMFGGGMYGGPMAGAWGPPGGGWQRDLGQQGGWVQQPPIMSQQQPMMPPPQPTAPPQPLIPPPRQWY